MEPSVNYVVSGTKVIITSFNLDITVSISINYQ